MAIKLFKEMSKEEDIHIMELPIDEIKPNPYQQRKYFDFYSLNRLTDSIKKYGVIQPVTVRIVNGKTYELVAGERTLLGQQGLKQFPQCLLTLTRRKAQYSLLLKICRERI